MRDAMTTLPFVPIRSQPSSWANQQFDLVGRAEELELLDSVLLSAEQASPGVLLRGGRGIGKTVLLRAAAERAQATGRQVIWVTGAQFESGLRFSGLHQLLYSLRGYIELLSAPQRQVLRRILEPAVAPEQLAISAATLDLVTAAASESSITLLLDDVQWIDQTTAEVLAFVARRSCDLTELAMVGATTDGRTPLSKAGLLDHEVAPLPERSADLLLDTRHPALAGRVRRRVLDEAAGNPLVLLELPEALSESERSDALPLPLYLRMSPRLTERFGEQIVGVSASTRRVLLLAALEPTADLAVIAEAAQSADPLDDLCIAEHRGLVDLSSHRLVFAHPVIRQMVVHLASRSERREAHRVLAAVVQEDPDRSAWHLAEASTGQDELVADALADVGTRAAGRGSISEAARAFSRAAELSGSPVGRFERRASAAYLAWRSGWLRWAMRLNQDSFESDTAENSGICPTAIKAYFLSFHDGDVDTARRRLIQAFEELPETSTMRRLVLEMLLHVCAVAGRAEHWEAFDTLLRRHDSGTFPLIDLCRDALVEPVREGRRARDRLVNLFESSLPVGVRAECTSLVPLATAAIAVDATPEFRQALRGHAHDELDDDDFMTLVCEMELFYHAGRWDESERSASRGLAQAESAGLEVFGNLFRGQLALLAAVRGQSDVALRLTDEVLEWATPRGVGLVSSLAWQARSLTASGLGEYERAYTSASHVTPAGVVTHGALNAPWMVLDLVEAAVRTGRAAEARAHVAAARAAGLDEMSPRIAMLVAGAAALVAPDERTGAMFRRASAMPGRDRWPFEHARIRLAHGEWLRRTKDIGRARQELGAALEVMDRLNARPWATRAREELRAAGQDVVRSVATRRAVLTAQEEAITRLAARGLTNKQIAAKLHLSDRTVGGHLYKVFPKLGVTSRTGLRDALDELVGVGEGGTAD